MSKTLPPGIAHLPPGVIYVHLPACIHKPHQFRALSPHTGKMKSRSFATVKAGMDWASGQRASMKARTVAEGRVMWHSAVDDYIAGLRKSGRRERYIASVVQITSTVSAWVPGDLTKPAFREIVRDGLDQLKTAAGSRQPGQPVSAGTKLCYLATIRAVVHAAVVQHHLPFDPVAGVKAPRTRKTIMQTLTMDEARSCVAPAMKSDPYFLRFALLLYLGLRERSEGLQLRWEDYDTDRQIMQVRERDGINQLKTGEREIPVPRELTEILDETPRRGPYLVCDEIRLGGNGDLVADRTDYTRFKAYLRRALLPLDPTEKQSFTVNARVDQISRHSLRHLHARIMAATGVSLASLKSRLGHTAISTTMIYAEGADSYEALVEKWTKGQWMLRPVVAEEQAVAQ